MLQLNPLSHTKISATMQKKMSLNDGAMDLGSVNFPAGLNWLIINNFTELQSVPTPVLQLRQLTTMDLSHNALESIPSTVRVFRQKFTFEDAIELHAFAPLEALACV